MSEGVEVVVSKDRPSPILRKVVDTPDPTVSQMTDAESRRDEKIFTTAVDRGGNDDKIRLPNRETEREKREGRDGKSLWIMKLAL